jgi:hypothetical protein
MNIEEITFELELAGLTPDQQRKILLSIQRTGFDPKVVDHKLVAMGYERIFTIYDDEPNTNQKS